MKLVRFLVNFVNITIMILYAHFDEISLMLLLKKNGRLMIMLCSLKENIYK